MSSPIDINLGQMVTSSIDAELEPGPIPGPVPGVDSLPPTLEEVFPAVTRLADSLVQEARQELAQAEAKAVWLLSAAVIALGAVISGLISGNWSPGSMKSVPAEGVLWLGLLSAGAGVYWLAMALMPKMVNDTEKHRLGYFGHAAAYGGKGKARQEIRAELGAALVATATRPYDLDRLADRLFDISSIVLRKYRRIRKAIQALGVSSLLIALALTMEAVLH